MKQRQTRIESPRTIWGLAINQSERPLEITNYQCNVDHILRAVDRYSDIGQIDNSTIRCIPVKYEGIYQAN